MVELGMVELGRVVGGLEDPSNWEKGEQRFAGFLVDRTGLKFKTN